MNADQAITRSVLGIDAVGLLQIRREVSKSRGRKASDRPDLVVEANGQVVAVVEVKLLAGLGIEQLERYYRYVAEEDRDDCRFVAVSLQRIRLDTTHAQDWQNLTWEELIAPFASSRVPWAATTATAWTSHIESQVPEVDGHTIWNQIDGIDLYLALRLRAAYMHDNVALPGGSSKAIREIGSGGLYVAIVDAPIPGSGYTVRWDATESLPTQEVGKLVDSSGLRGVDFRFFLVQQRVTSSKAFDWDHLVPLRQEYLAQRTGFRGDPIRRARPCSGRRMAWLDSRRSVLQRSSALATARSRPSSAVKSSSARASCCRPQPHSRKPPRCSAGWL